MQWKARVHITHTHMEPTFTFRLTSAVCPPSFLPSRLYSYTHAHAPTRNQFHVLFCFLLKTSLGKKRKKKQNKQKISKKNQLLLLLLLFSSTDSNCTNCICLFRFSPFYQRLTKYLSFLLNGSLMSPFGIDAITALEICSRLVILTLRQ